LLLAACGSHNGGTSTPSANVRFVNASSDATLTVNFNATPEYVNVPPASATSYVPVTPGTASVTVTGTSGTLASPASNLAFASAQTYTLLAYVRDGAIVLAQVAENQVVPAAGNSTIGIANLSPDSGALDVYVVAPGTTTLAGLAPTFQSTSYRAAPAWATFVSGSFDIWATAGGNQNDIRLHLPAVSLAGGEVVLLATTSTGGGALVNAALLTSAPSAQFIAASNARVRVVSALPVNGSSPVTASVGTTSLAPVFSPNPGTYTLVTGGATSYTLSIAGTPVANLPAATFGAGSDYTIVVYGAVNAPIVAVYTDTNQVPTVGGDVNLRLINAGVTATGGLTLYDNNVAVASALPYGAASAYFGVPAVTAALELVAPSLTSVTLTQPLGPTGSVYTVFVIDSSLTPYVIRDR